VHDIIGDIIDWDEAHKAYLVGADQTGERYNQRLEAARRMAEIEARWQHLPEGFHGEWKRIKVHIRAVADAAQSMSSEELCWLAIAAASAWVPKPAVVEEPPPRSRAPFQSPFRRDPATGSRNRVYLWHAGHQNLTRSTPGSPCSALRIVVPQWRQGRPARP
jgi:hypothetical protein